MKSNQKLREQVVRILLRDARKSLREIAREVGASTTTVSRAVAALEKDGTIRGYSAEVDWAKLGYRALLCLQVQAKPGASVEKLGASLRALPQVRQVFYTTGGACISAYLACRDNDEAAAALEKIGKMPGVEAVNSHMVLRSF